MVRRGCLGVIKHGTAKDLADVGVGYVASGASEHSRQVAHGVSEKLPSHATAKVKNDTSLEGKIAWQKTALAKLKFDLSFEKSPDKRAKLEKNIGIKTAFLERLRSER